MVYVFLADGTEEVEALTVVDVLRRAGAKVRTVGIPDRSVRGSHGITIEADLSEDEARREAVTERDLSLAVLPGGMPGTLNLDASAAVDEIVRETLKRGGTVGAICAAPLILGRRGLLDGKKGTCYPGFEKELKGCEISEDPVVVDGQIVTSRGMGTALPFALALTEILYGEERANGIASSVLYHG
ncbi:MAG: DJ-1/PfpI family protein [Clostridia bacterium]|nr:DJ-1/PfpI family protein [Clostridia bacterium]